MERNKLTQPAVFLIVFIVIIFFVFNPADNRRYVNDRLIRSVEIEADNSLPESYRKIKDSLDRIGDWKVSRLRAAGESMSIGFIGVSKITECDSCNSLDRQKFADSYKDKYFIRLNSYTLKDDASFFIRNDRYYFRYTVWDKVGENGKSNYSAIKESPVRFSIGNTDKETSVLIPVSRKTYNILKVVIYFFYILLILAAIYLGIIIPVRILYSIGTGAFTKKNIRRLHMAGWIYLGLGIAFPLIAVIIEWILDKKIPPETHYPFILSVFDNRPLLVAGLIVLLIANAFKRGYRLQQEQDLTV